jgi:hypothetical protein
VSTSRASIIKEPLAFEMVPFVLPFTCTVMFGRDANDMESTTMPLIITFLDCEYENDVASKIIPIPKSILKFIGLMRAVVILHRWISRGNSF